ncbi:MAG TPA: hypothetical protein VFQ38_08590 [Longimicrobiales bacterium]|nr:hypothetical protein [Longimicrobiales bacterium]
MNPLLPPVGGPNPPAPKPLAVRERARVVQVIPAPGWVAVFAREGGETRLPLAAWALLEYTDDRSGEERFTIGLVAGTQPRLVRADHVEGLVGYEYAGERAG